ncbi:hypothetical protein [Luteimicrobium sp. DT211]|uniref:sunset domain-containing protein n=1 Tax=Luteimicrobium sp. DT211 TaxID=3393412 RepID=UPI003CE81CA3
MRSLRSLVATVLVGGLLVSGSAVVATAAQAAPVHTVAVAAKVTPTKVTIKKIASKTAPYKGKTTIKPRVTASGRVSVKSKTLTVKHGSATVAKNKKSVKLKAGTYRVTTKVTYKTYTLKKSGSTTVKVWSATKSKSLAQKLVIKAGKRPSHTAPISAWDCPSWAPIKGNADSGIYHLPGGRYYNATKPEICFTTTAAARAAGYRASRNG